MAEKAQERHVMLTGPIRGNVELDDGTIVDVTPGQIDVTHLDAEEVAHKIGLRYAEEGHPDDFDIEVDEKTGKKTRVQREFVYEAPARFAKKKD